MGIKQHSNLFIAIKSKGNISKYMKNKKAFERIKSLGLINPQKYLKTHTICEKEKLDPILHYMYYGYKDSEKSYVNSLFDIDFYKDNYESVDPIMDYV